MDLILNSALPYTRQMSYKGLRPRDIVIWESFIKRFPDAFDFVWYDTVLGDPTRPGDDEAAMKAGGAYQVMQWRIDVIGSKGDFLYIVEIKPDALAGALGQVLAYKALLINEGRISPDVRCMVLTDSLSPITEKAAGLLGVTILVP